MVLFINIVLIETSPIFSACLSTAAHDRLYQQAQKRREQQKRLEAEVQGPFFFNNVG